MIKQISTRKVGRMKGDRERVISGMWDDAFHMAFLGLFVCTIACWIGTTFSWIIAIEYGLNDTLDIVNLCLFNLGSITFPIIIYKACRVRFGVSK